MRTVTSLAALAAGVTLFAQPLDLDVIRIRENVLMIAGAGSNVTVQFGRDGAVVVDAGALANADELVAAIKEMTAADSLRHRHQRRWGPRRRKRKVAKAGRTLFQTNNQLARA